MNDSFEAFSQSVYDELVAKGVTPIQAFYDEGMNCLICGESGRCPGWHTPEELEASRPDALAYLVQATTEIADEKKFTPSSEDEFRAWLLNHHAEIGQRAIDLQCSMLNQLLKPELQQFVHIEMAHRVYEAIHNRK